MHCILVKYKEQQTILGHRWFTAQFCRPGSDTGGGGGLAEQCDTGGSEDQRGTGGKEVSDPKRSWRTDRLRWKNGPGGLRCTQGDPLHRAVLVVNEELQDTSGAGKSGDLDGVSWEDGDNGMGRIFGGIGSSMMSRVVGWRGTSSVAKFMSQRSSIGSSENHLTGLDSLLDLPIGSSLGTGATSALAPGSHRPSAPCCKVVDSPPHIPPAFILPA